MRSWRKEGESIHIIKEAGMGIYGKFFERNFVRWSIKKFERLMLKKKKIQGGPKLLGAREGPLRANNESHRVLN